MQQSVQQSSFRAFFALLIGACCCLAQSSTATLKGVVADAEGNVLPPVTVTLTNQANGLKKNFFTDAIGQYHFTYLEPGLYQLEAQAPNFKSFRQSALKLEVGQTVEVPIKLALGDLRETVTVSAVEVVRAKLQFRAEAFNAFNRANFLPPGTTLGLSNFGVITSTEDPRQFQAAMRLYF